MTSGVCAIAQAIADGVGAPAVAKVGPNVRVMAASGPLSVVGEVVTFPGPTATGAWTTGAARVTIGGLPCVNASSTGPSVTLLGAPGGPIRLQLPDSRISAG